MIAAALANDQHKPRKGWGWPTNSKKAHYFFDGHSLCGKWFFLGAVDDDAAGATKGPDNCAACQRKYAHHTRHEEKP